jgi:nitrogenase subunit NifH
MSGNLVIKNLPNAMGLFMVANGLLMPITGLGLDSIKAMSLSVERDIGLITNQSNVLANEFFPNGVPSFIKNYEVGVIAFIFMVNQLKERGNESEEIINLSIALNQSDLMLTAIKELKEYKSNTANVLDVMKHSDLFKMLDLVSVPNN